MSPFNAVERTAQAIAKLGWGSLSLSEEMALQNNSSFRMAVEKRVEEIHSSDTNAAEPEPN